VFLTNIAQKLQKVQKNASIFLVFPVFEGLKKDYFIKGCVCFRKAN